MHILRCAAITTVALIGLSSAASAADLPVKAAPQTPVAMPPPVYNWTGFYVGGQLGYLWGRSTVEEDGSVVERNAPTDGTIGGVLAGYNWQNGPLVFGIEGDFGWTNAHGTGLVAANTTPNTYDLNWASYLRTRFGYAFNTWLFYVAGGFAVADLDFHEGNTAAAPGGRYYGWTIGGGAELAITQNVVGRVEYLYADYGHKDYKTDELYRVSLTGQTVRGALAWKF